MYSDSVRCAWPRTRVRGDARQWRIRSGGGVLRNQTNCEETDVVTQPASLYDHLGGFYPIATVVDDFIDRIIVDDRLNKNPRVDEAHHKVLPAGFKYLVT